MPEILTNVTFPGSQTVDGVDISAHVADVTTLHLPSQASQSGKFLTTNGSVASWATITITGDVVGPSGATDNAIARFDTATGKLLQNSLVTIDDTGSINIPSGQSYKINGTALTAANVGAAATSHAHGNVTTDGKIGTTATIPIITGTGGVLQAGSFGTGAGTFCQGNDSRLSDARTPTAHTHGNITNTGYIGTTATLPIITGTGGILQAGSFGTGAGTFCQGNDSRLSDARTPTAHVLNSASHTVSGLTTGHFLKALSATTFGFAAHGLTYTDVGAAASSHTHNYAGSASAGGDANAVAQSITFNNGGAGAASGTTFDGSVARTISYNTIGAAASSHSHTEANLDLTMHAASKVGAPSTPANNPATVMGSTYPPATPYTYGSVSLTAGLWVLTFNACILGYRSSLGHVYAWIEDGSGTQVAAASATSTDYPSSTYIAANCARVVTVTSTTTFTAKWQGCRGELNTTAAGRFHFMALKVGV